MLEEPSSGLGWDLGAKGERKMEDQISSWVEGVSSGRKGGTVAELVSSPGQG